MPRPGCHLAARNRESNHNELAKETSSLSPKSRYVSLPPSPYLYIIYQTFLSLSFTEIELDKTRTWCPRAGCETICMVGTAGTASTATTAGGATTGLAGSAICQMDESPSTSQSYTPQQDGAQPLLSISVHCPSCKDEFCALCKKAVSKIGMHLPNFVSNQMN